MSDDSPSAEMQLISDSVDNASARIRFFRIAYGAATADQFISQGEVTAILGAMARGGRFTYAWEVADDPRRLEVRLVFLLLQCFESALPFGGEVAISSTGTAWKIEATGRKISADPSLWDDLGTVRASDDIGPAQVHFALMPDALKEANRKLTADIQNDRIVVTF